MRALCVNIIYNRSNTFGLAADAVVLEEILREQAAFPISQVNHIDPCEPPRYADIQFHLEIPIAVAFAWSPVNIFVKNAEHYISESYDAYMGNFNAVINRESSAWCLPKELSVKLSAAATTGSKQAGFLALVGGSANKASALVSQILPFWKADWVPLHIYTTRSDLRTQMEAAASATALAIPSNIHIHQKELADAQIRKLQMHHQGHLIASVAEGFCYAAAEAEACGAFKILSDIPVLRSQYNESADTVFIAAATASADLESAMQKFTAWEPQAPSVATIMSRRSATADMLSAILTSCKSALTTTPMQLPPILLPESCPPISIITLTYNRRNFIDLACLNLLLTDYPQEKIEWVVVEDSDDDNKAASDKILGFAARNPKIQVSYVPIGHRLTVGEKRNKGIERASNPIILFMDDDDVYPATSIRRRVAWLLKGGMGTGCQKPQAVATTTIAMYDLRTGQSAVNVPPLGLPLGQRISEATLTFYKNFWNERHFKDVAVGEGEDWLAGRENGLLEIPPQQIIVALSHGTNISSRAIPKEAKVGCFWGWDEVMLRFLHGLAGVAVEAEDDTSGKKKKH